MNTDIFFFLFLVTGVVVLGSLVLLVIVISFIYERIKMLMRLRRLVFSLHRSRELVDAYVNMASKAAMSKLFGGTDIEPIRIHWPTQRVRRRYLNRLRPRGFSFGAPRSSRKPGDSGIERG